MFAIVLAECKVISYDKQQYESIGRVERHYYEKGVSKIKEQDFIEKVHKCIGDKCKKSKILESVVIAQAILESGWGTSELYMRANNMFALNNYHDNVSKIYGDYPLKVPQEVNGKWVYNVEIMAKHKDLAESVEHLMRWYTMRDKYKPIVDCKDYKKVCNFLVGKYATDSKYNTKLINLIEKYNLTKYDTVSTNTPVNNSNTYTLLQVGRYYNESYAISYFKQLLSKGYQACITKVKTEYIVFVITRDKDGTIKKLKSQKIDYIENVKEI